jgi:hypothetical protein
MITRRQLEANPAHHMQELNLQVIAMRHVMHTL